MFGKDKKEKQKKGSFPTGGPKNISPRKEPRLMVGKSVEETAENSASKEDNMVGVLKNKNGSFTIMTKEELLEKGEKKKGRSLQEIGGQFMTKKIGDNGAVTYVPAVTSDSRSFLNRNKTRLGKLAAGFAIAAAIHTHGAGDWTIGGAIDKTAHAVHGVTSFAQKTSNLFNSSSMASTYDPTENHQQARLERQRGDKAADGKAGSQLKQANNFGTERWKNSQPEKVYDLVRDVTRDNPTLAPHLYAIAGLESVHILNARNEKTGALGLLQIMPKTTARELAYKYGPEIGRPDLKKLVTYNPKSNTPYGIISDAAQQKLEFALMDPITNLKFGLKLLEEKNETFKTTHGRGIYITESYFSWVQGTSGGMNLLAAYNNDEQREMKVTAFVKDINATNNPKYFGDRTVAEAYQTVQNYVIPLKNQFEHTDTSRNTMAFNTSPNFR